MGVAFSSSSGYKFYTGDFSTENTNWEDKGPYRGLAEKNETRQRPIDRDSRPQRVIRVSVDGPWEAYLKGQGLSGETDNPYRTSV